MPWDEHGYTGKSCKDESHDPVDRLLCKRLPKEHAYLKAEVADKHE
jgi:hypothetical protein